MVEGPLTGNDATVLQSDPQEDADKSKVRSTRQTKGLERFVSVTCTNPLAILAELIPGEGGGKGGERDNSWTTV